MKHLSQTNMHVLGAVGLLLLAGLGCASTTPPSRELQQARGAYHHASGNGATQLAPDRLYAARKALTIAEEEHQADPGEFQEKQLAYVALRLSEAASTQTELVRASKELEAANERFEAVRLKAREEELARARQDLSDTNYEASELEEKVTSTEKQLTGEQAARQAAEKEAAMLRETLAALSKLKQSNEALSISLSGSVLFESGKSTLLPSAERVLDEVAKALKTQQSERTIVVYGHTDSVGNDQANIALSKARAEAVRDYVVKKGVHPARIKAEGKGEASPVSSNDSAEGRAQNRRVEIEIGERGGD
jgi:outer membrane protein OmpA-like peptidoglycan-associated protein